MVYVGFGSNLGDRFQYFERSKAAIHEAGFRIRCDSRLYKTDPWGGAEGGAYLNAVLELEPLGKPEDLLACLLEIERELGRTRSHRCAARTCDLDLLLWADVCMESVSLTLPHPRLHLRRFVLVPLCDLIPDCLHPIEQKSFFDILQALDDSNTVRPFDPRTK